MTSNTKAQRFRKLAKEAAECEFCPRMSDQRAVLGPANGPLNIRIVMVAEAPGRFGAGRTGIPFSGDRSGENFEFLLRHSRLTRKDIFITNAALCNPLENGNNSRPTAAELKNCSYYLESVLDIIRPELVVTLGTVGLQSINRLLGTDYRLYRDTARLQSTPRFLLLPLYHPSPRVTNWRRTLDQQKRDFKKIPLALKNSGPC